MLDLKILDTHSLDSICIMDASKYPTNFNIVNPSIEITPPGYSSVVLPFTPSSIQLYKSTNLGIVCDLCSEVNLPDGIWKFKYTVYPQTTYFVEKNFIRVDNLQAKLDEVYLTLDMSECDTKIKEEDKKFLENVESYMQGAVAAGNKCVSKLFTTFYTKASEAINKFINRKSCV